MMISAISFSNARQLAADKDHKMRHVHIRYPMIGLIKRGRKTFLRNQSSHDVMENELFILQKDSHWDIFNNTLGKGHYCSHIINLSPDTLQLFYRYYPQIKPIKTQDCISCHSKILFECFQRTWLSLQDPHLSDQVKQHRTLELLLQLSELDIYFPLPQNLSWTEKMQYLVENDLAKSWRLSEIAATFHISESTLKRRLLREGTHFRQWLQDLRLDTALSLILSTSKNLADIAQLCGYHSQSRFSAAFKKRFDLLPSMIKTDKMTEYS
ncbi:helix-turn-helix transcriptional regulator [Testudinibacter sp. TR-2022]|uniref:helix-turn-helix transcriptional regulator n=1 Tax=Testudinibacter sp. TR-2022 TaxID=2585029 RepID=UPI00111BC54C|nr:helix-turn-helix transcriptional regulator [Testudinibacter sp. TR-2022]TNH03746.1 helix-turn-helix transcriptional regulator [Pasteurellaceae bacterium Phil31]TNH11689.1 helix-turn-helix transcriptional regulator [Testudinibacter sp. TR-2022]TNH12059.1 helix-turn-helix transcriptional regulator [Testudinibacter sp. TR-2022]TNH15520.1 helix-turn-helix transcriptional regulator [Testudinibacter sp. TR-2022]TNH15646.1 helix-turn-helix transcriptional regulator [Testudinibacter sp. TR-2022]